MEVGLRKLKWKGAGGRAIEKREHAPLPLQRGNSRFIVKKL
jgi:hypothetical protein